MVSHSLRGCDGEERFYPDNQVCPKLAWLFMEGIHLGYFYEGTIFTGRSLFPLAERRHGPSFPP